MPQGKAPRHKALQPCASRCAAPKISHSIAVIQLCLLPSHPVMHLSPEAAPHTALADSPPADLSSTASAQPTAAQVRQVHLQPGVCLCAEHLR